MALAGPVLATRQDAVVALVRTWVANRFFAQIVENRETQLSSHFLGPGDIFPKSYDENRFVWQLYGIWDLRIRPARA